MPDFELMVSATDHCAPGALAALPNRFPEIAVLDRYRSLDAEHELWLCRAPSVSHIERWVGESALGTCKIRVVMEP